MEGTDPDRSAARRYLESARAVLRQLDFVATPDGADMPRGIVRSAIQSAMSELDGLGRSLAPDVSQVQRVACPYCGSMVMPAATLCGFCWRKLSPKARE